MGLALETVMMSRPMRVPLSRRRTTQPPEHLLQIMQAKQIKTFLSSAATLLLYPKRSTSLLLRDKTNSKRTTCSNYKT